MVLILLLLNQSSSLERHGQALVPGFHEGHTEMLMCGGVSQADNSCLSPLWSPDTVTVTLCPAGGRAKVAKLRFPIKFYALSRVDSLLLEKIMELMSMQ